MANVESEQQRIVYDVDDRMEYYDVADERLRELADASIVALVHRSSVVETHSGLDISAETLGTAADLCDGEPFAAQPAVALCSGALIDWDLVLTAGHCLRSIGMAQLVVLFGFRYEAPGQLASLAAQDRFDLVEIVSERRDPPEDTERVDYAVVRLDRPVVPPRAPVPIRSTPAPLAEGEPLVTLGFPGGVPLKVDLGGRVRDSRAATLDHFIGDTDTLGGSSGGPTFTEDLTLVGVLARGGPDLFETDSGCNIEFRQTNGAETAEEQFTYSHQALIGLCQQSESGSSLCRSDCGDPCVALPQKALGGAGGGCAVQGSRPWFGWMSIVTFWLAVSWRRRSQVWPGRQRTNHADLAG